MNRDNQHITGICYYPVEIVIDGPGKEVKTESALPLTYDKVEGVAILHPGGNHGNGTLELSVAGEEIFPKGFHARAYMMEQSSHHAQAFINRGIDSYLYRFEERAKGATVSAKYTEPGNGESGVLYLVFKLTRQATCR